MGLKNFTCISNQKDIIKIKGHSIRHEKYICDSKGFYVNKAVLN